MVITDVFPSKLRQIPDHQEVYLKGDGLASIIFDVLERVTGFDTDEEAFKYHLEDVADGGDGIRVWGIDRVTMAKLPYGSSLELSIPLPDNHISIGSAYTLFATTYSQKNNVPAAGNAVPDFTAVIMILVRLAQQNTDILITINVPHVKGQYEPHEINLEDGRTGAMINDAQKIRDQIIATFQIRDWDLFGR